MIVQGDARFLPLASGSVQCVVTSPPYWGLRDYKLEPLVWGGDKECSHQWGAERFIKNSPPRDHAGAQAFGSTRGIEPQRTGTTLEASQGAWCRFCSAWRGSLGLEPIPDLYVQHLVEIFREVRRVLRDDGTVWLNIGDSYAGSTTAGIAGLKPKDLVGIPWRVAFALQQPYYTGQIKDERDRTWLAALVDGEGCLTIMETTAPNWSGKSYPSVLQVRMCDREPLDKCVRVTGYSSTSPKQHPPSQGGVRDSFQWRLTGGRAAGIAAELYPYLLIKKKQALIAWNHEQVRDAWVGKNTLPRGSIEQQQQCRELIQRLNRHESADIPHWMKEPPLPVEPGWYLRSDCIWAKGYSFHPTSAGSCMPESITDRPTRGHEYLFLLTKSARYFYDIEAVKEAGIFPAGTRAAKGSGKREGNRRPDEYAEYSGKRNLRSVWLINPKPYREAHFATFPPTLVRPCLLAGSASAQCAACKVPYRHVVVREPIPPDIRQRFEAARQQTVERSGRTDGYTNSKPNFVRRVLSNTWEPGCTCAAPSEPQCVLDPFGGSGTVALVARELGRRAIVLDLNADYCQLARKREEAV